MVLVLVTSGVSMSRLLLLATDADDAVGYEHLRKLHNTFVQANAVRAELRVFAEWDQITKFSDRDEAFNPLLRYSNRGTKRKHTVDWTEDK